MVMAVMPTHTDVIWCSLLTLVYIFAPALALRSTLQKMHVTFTQCLLFRLGNFDFIYSSLLMVSYFCDPHFLIALCFLTICLPRSLSSVSFSPSFTSLPALFWRLVSHVGLLLLLSFVRFTYWKKWIQFTPTDFFLLAKKVQKQIASVACLNFT